MRSFRIASLKLRTPTLPSTILLLAYLIFSILIPYQIVAAEVGSIANEGHNLPHTYSALKELDSRVEVTGYESDFFGVDRAIIGRAEENQALANNAPGQRNIELGEEQFWIFPKQALFGPQSPPTPPLPIPRDSPDPPGNDQSGEKTLYISLTTCRQPYPKDPNNKAAPDQLKLHVSTNQGNKQPSVTQADSAIAVGVEEGFGSLQISAKDDVYFGISAPNHTDYADVYNYQLTASIDGFYASYQHETNLHFIDSDANSTLLYTAKYNNGSSDDPDVQQWLKWPPRFSIFVQNDKNPSVVGIRRSVCGLQDFADVRDPQTIDTGMTSAGSKSPNQQFHIPHLNASSSYTAMLAIVGNSTDSGNGIVGGGGVVWDSLPFRTKSSTNCGLIFNLTFCTSIAYSAPTNPNISNKTALGQKYDDYAKDQYLNFSRSLQQVPCNTTSSAQYSLNKTCADCDQAYKTWLCAVTIPRCEDLSNEAPFLQSRNMKPSPPNSTLIAQTATSFASNVPRNPFASTTARNPTLDSDIKPGPYKEVLPCADLCYKLVQSCPASLQFSCPLESHGLEYTYGTLQGYSPTNVTCSFPEAGILTSSGSRTVSLATLIAASGVFLFITM